MSLSYFYFTRQPISEEEFNKYNSCAICLNSMLILSRHNDGPGLHLILLAYALLTKKIEFIYQSFINIECRITIKMQTSHFQTSSKVEQTKQIRKGLIVPLIRFNYLLHPIAIRNCQLDAKDWLAWNTALVLTSNSCLESISIK